METIEAVLSATGSGTVTAGSESVEVAPPGDVAAARHAILRAAADAVKERGEVCRLVIDDMGTRHVFALYPDGTREPLTDDEPVSLPAPAAVESPAWRRETAAVSHPAPAAVAPVRSGPIPAVPPLPAVPLIPPAPLLPAGPRSEPTQLAPTGAGSAHEKPAPSAQPAPVAPIGGNPFVRAAEPVKQAEEIETDPILGDVLEQEGLGAPRMARDVAPATPVPPRPIITPETVWLLGASGGVGVSTLAALAGGRVIDGGVYPPHAGAPVWVVASTHAAGLEAAVEVARANARGEVTVEILGLILVHDRPKLSKASIQWARQVSSVYSRSMTVPYMPAWRDPGTPEVGKNVRVRLVLAALAPKKRKKL